MRVIYGKTWACHSTGDTPCVGALIYLKKKGLPYKVEDKVLLNEKSDWYNYINTKQI
jgi:hypothetical protein